MANPGMNSGTGLPLLSICRDSGSQLQPCQRQDVVPRKPEDGWRTSCFRDRSDSLADLSILGFLLACLTGGLGGRRGSRDSNPMTDYQSRLSALSRAERRASARASLALTSAPMMVSNLSSSFRAVLIFINFP